MNPKNNKDVKNTSVKKMLSDEEMALLGTLQSTINELMTLNSAEGSQGGEGEGQDIKAMLEKLSAMNQPDNQGLNKSNDGPTGNDSAEERAKASTDVNDKNLSEVGKLLQLLTPVFKSNNNSSTTDSGNVSVIVSQAIEKSLSPLVQELNQVKVFNENLLDALGVAKSITDSVDFGNNQVVNKNLPVQSVDNSAIVGELLSVIKEMAGNNNSVVGRQIDGIPNLQEGLQESRKALREAMPFIFQQKGR